MIKIKNKNKKWKICIVNYQTNPEQSQMLLKGFIITKTKNQKQKNTDLKKTINK